MLTTCRYTWDQSPVMIDYNTMVYSLPHVPDGVNGVKVSRHGIGQVVESADHIVTPATREWLDTQVGWPNAGAVEALPVTMHEGAAGVCMKWVSEHFPGVDSTHVDHHYRCMYTSVAGANQEFIIGKHFDDPDHVIVGCVSWC